MNTGTSVQNIEEFKDELIRRLRTIGPKTVILFGSHASGIPTEDSDIDLYVVTKDQFIPQNYKEKRELVRKVSRALIDMRQKISIDLLVHTDSMSKKFFSLDSHFAKEIKEKGIQLL